MNLWHLSADSVANSLMAEKLRRQKGNEDKYKDQDRDDANGQFGDTDTVAHEQGGEHDGEGEGKDEDGDGDEDPVMASRP